MIEVTPSIQLSEDEIHIEFVRSSGPGGQNVNKVATAAQLRFNAASSPNLPDEVRERLYKIAGSRMNAEGELVIEARRYRTQEQNRQDALARLVALIQQAAEPPKPRHKTRPTFASRHKRLESKRRSAEKKRMRRRVDASHLE